MSPQESKQSKCKALLNKLKSVSYSLIPLNELRDLPTKKGICIIFLFYFSLLLFFIFLVTWGYFLHQNDKYLTLQEEQFTGYGTCNTIPRILDGRYIADYDGNWDLDVDFKHSQGLLDLTFTNFEGK